MWRNFWEKVCMMIGKYRICQFAGMSILVLSKHQHVQILNKAIITEYVETLSSRERERERGAAASCLSCILHQQLDVPASQKHNWSGL